jgi:hypothetical protein
MMKNRVQRLTRNPGLVLAAAAALLVGGLTPLHAQDARGADRGPFPTGLWYSPSDAGVPQGFSFTAIHADGTFNFNSVFETGGSQVFPGEYTSLNGLWTREGDRLVLRGFSIQETETPAGSLFAISRVVWSFEVDGRNELFGMADADFLPCASEVNCPNPDENPLVIGEGVTGGLPVVFRRMSRQDF